MHHANNRVIGILFDHLLCKEYKKSHSRLVFSPVCQEKKAMYRYDRSHDWEEQKNCTFAQVKNIRMTPFLQQIATLFYETYGTDVQQMVFVFPNRRAGLFFRKYLSQAAGRPIFSPTIRTISELFAQLSDKQPADRLQMLFLLYHIYIRHSGAKETFDDFVFWGEMLLNDFDDVDKYMADARQLFTNVTDLHEVEKDWSYLQTHQIEAIRAFWSSFRPGEEGASRRYFLSVWQMLYAVYRELRDTLAAQGKGYEGMISREVVERIEREGTCRLPYSKVIFVGLSALSKTEHTLLQLLKQQEIADFYW